MNGAWQMWFHVRVNHISEKIKFDIVLK